jgi:hypothetical protein
MRDWTRELRGLGGQSISDFAPALRAVMGPLNRKA